MPLAPIETLERASDSVPPENGVAIYLLDSFANALWLESVGKAEQAAELRREVLRQVKAYRYYGGTR